MAAYSDNGTKCDAHVWIDNIKVGVWRINPYKNIIIERPINHFRKFILMNENSSEIINIKNRNNTNNNNGLIKIEFKPEEFQTNSSFSNIELLSYCNMTNVNTCKSSNYYDCSSNISNLSQGITVLGDNSNQRFRKVSPLHNIDINKITIIYARLVIDNNKIKRKKYISLGDNNNSTNIPPPLDNYTEYQFNKKAIY